MRTRVALALAAVGLTASLLPAAARSEAVPQYEAEIRRTEYGIPHITADDWGGLGFGAGYAFAEDNLCVFADTIVTVNARRALHFGPDGSYTSEANGVVANNLESDFFYQRVIDSGVIDDLLAGPNGPQPEVREAVRGYAAGYNAYLRDVGGPAGVPDPQCQGAGWVRPITEADLYRRFYQLSLFASQGALLNYIVAAQPPPPGAPATAPDPAATPIDLSGLPSAENLAIGSNAYALGREATSTGRGMVLGNPHFPWQGPERFHEMHLTIPGEVDVIGAALFGSPAVLIGHNQHIAWSHTVSVPYRFSPYQLTLVPGDPTAYLYDGEVRHMTARTVAVPVAGEGGVEERTHTFYETHYGPMIHFPDALMPWTPVVGWAIRDANADNLRHLDHFLDVNRAESVHDVEAALAEHQGIPWVNTIAADDQGNAFYADMSVVPHVTDEQLQTCATPHGRVLMQLAALPALDGSRSACEWGSDPDAAVPGIFGPAALPKLHRGDFVANSNDSFWLSNPEQPLEGYPYVMGDERTARSLRTRLGIRMIEQRLDGSDGREGTVFTLDQLQETVFNNRQYAGELVRDDLVAECEEFPLVVLGDGAVVDISEACPVLAAWDVKVDLGSRGAHLFREFMRFGFGSSLGFFADQFDADDPVNTPRRLNRNNPEIRQALGEAVRRLRDAGVPLDAELGTLQSERRGDEVIPIHGGDEHGIFNYVSAPWNAEAGGYPDTEYGASIVMAVEFTDAGPRSRAILSYSQSTNPTSPHYADQTRLFSRKQWVDLRFTDDAINADPGLRSYTVTG